MKRTSLAIAAAMTALAGGAARAAPDASGNMRISAIVPAVCGLEAPTIAVEADQAGAVGTVREFCNSSDGYMIMAGHRPLEAGEQVRIVYDGEVSELSPSGLSPVAFRSGPRLRSVPVMLQTTGLQTGLAISLAMTAI